MRGDRERSRSRLVAHVSQVLCIIDIQVGLDFVWCRAFQYSFHIKVNIIIKSFDTFEYL